MEPHSLDSWVSLKEEKLRPDFCTSSNRLTRSHQLWGLEWSLTDRTLLYVSHPTRPRRYHDWPNPLRRSGMTNMKAAFVFQASTCTAPWTMQLTTTDFWHAAMIQAWLPWWNSRMGIICPHRTTIRWKLPMKCCGFIGTSNHNTEYDERHVEVEGSKWEALDRFNRWGIDKTIRLRDCELG